MTRQAVQRGCRWAGYGKGMEGSEDDTEGGDPTLPLHPMNERSL